MIDVTPAQLPFLRKMLADAKPHCEKDFSSLQVHKALEILVAKFEALDQLGLETDASEVQRRLRHIVHHPLSKRLVRQALMQ